MIMNAFIPLVRGSIPDVPSPIITRQPPGRKMILKLSQGIVQRMFSTGATKWICRLSYKVHIIIILKHLIKSIFGKTRKKYMRFSMQDTTSARKENNS
jgi:hypothetical protein